MVERMVKSQFCLEQKIEYWASRDCGTLGYIHGRRFVEYCKGSLYRSSCHQGHEGERHQSCSRKDGHRGSLERSLGASERQGRSCL